MSDLTRRERTRLATVNEILATARVHLVEQGAAALSLRSVARDMGMTASAIYRYFESRESLITALIVSSFSSLADAVHAADAARPRSDLSGRWKAATGTYRSWLLAHPAEHALLFGTAIPGYEKRHDDATSREFYRGVNVLFAIASDALVAGKFDPEPMGSEMTPTLRKQIKEWKAEEEILLPEPVLLGALACWTQMLGAINAELFCHLPKPMKGNDALFVQQMHHVFERAGFRP